MMDGVRSTCPYCGVGCGVLALPDGRVVGDPGHPANGGALCSKGAALDQTLDHGGRLTHPMRDGVRVEWDAALDAIADEIRTVLASDGPDAIGFYVSGQCLTEDYYVANKLMKGFIGSSNIDTNSRLCMASSVAGHQRAFGIDGVPGLYRDLEAADLCVLVGSNLAWCHPILYRRMMSARAERATKLVVIDPRRTASAEEADLHLAIRPGTDAALFNGLLTYLAAEGYCRDGWIAAHTVGFGSALAAADLAPEAVATATGLALADILAFYRWFAVHDRTVTVYSQGVNQSVCGTDKVNAIINCHLALGRVGQVGSGPFSVTGQPNAMGGREVGGLANQLAAHMRFDRPDDLDRVRRFWQAPHLSRKPGLKAVDLFRAAGMGRIKFLWIIATNPADSMPEADLVRRALDACPFVVVSDCWPTATTDLADLVLPAAGWGEKNGMVTNSERCLSRQRAFQGAPGAARADWWMLAEVGRRLGWAEAFAWSGPEGVFAEHAALSAFENDGTRPFNLGGLARMTAGDYAAFAPDYWPIPEPALDLTPTRQGAMATGAAKRLFGDGRFATPDGRARFVATPFVPPPDRADTLVLNTGRLRDQWHTMTRTGRVPRLMAHAPEPQVDFAPADAARLGIAQGDLVRIGVATDGVETDVGDRAVVLKAGIEPGQNPGSLFIPIHWTGSFGSAGAVARLVHDACDPVSGQPDLKGTVVTVTRQPRYWQGFLLHRDPVTPDTTAYWSRRPLATGMLYTLTGCSPWPERESLDWVRALLGTPPEGEELDYIDTGRGIRRFASLVDGRLVACVFLSIAATGVPSHEGLCGLLGKRIDAHQRRMILSGAVTTAPAQQTGRTVCACYSVGLITLETAIRQHRLASVADIGTHLAAGTNCGACIPELKKILSNINVLS